MKKKKYDNGGLLKELLPSILGLIPGGNIVNTGLSLFNQLDNQPQAYKPAPVLSSNPFGLQNGGKIPPNYQTLDNIKFDSNQARQDPMGFLIVKDENTGKDFGVIRKADGTYEWYKGNPAAEKPQQTLTNQKDLNQFELIGGSQSNYIRDYIDSPMFQQKISKYITGEKNQIEHINNLSREAYNTKTYLEPFTDPNKSRTTKSNIKGVKSVNIVGTKNTEQTGVNSLILNQMSHSSGLDGANVPSMLNDINNIYKKENTVSPTNYKSDVDAVRYLMQQQGIYNPGTTEFKKEFFEKALRNQKISNDPAFKRLRENSRSDDWMIQGLIELASTENKSSVRKAALGGPILPIAQESTYVQPRPFLPQLPIVQPIDPNLQVQQMRASKQYNPITGLGVYDANGGTGKVHSKDRFREKSKGGLINDDFKQYNSGSHKSGNDTEIDQFGNPVSNGVAAIQNKENMYKGFILSDTLTNPETGNKFNVDAMKINKKYPNARLSDIDKNSLDFEMNKLQVLNQEKIDKKESKMAKGGYIRPTITNPYLPQGVADGDPMQAYNRSNELLQLPNTPVIPDGNPVEAYNQAGSLISPLYTNLNPLPTPLQSRSAADLNLPVFNSTTNTTNQVTGTGSNTTERSGLGTLDAIGLGLKGAALLGSVSDAFSSPEIEQPILPSYDRSNQYLQQANVDFSQSRQDAQGISNQQSNAIRSMSGNSAGNYLSRQSGRLAQLQEVMANIGMQENNQRSQLNLNKANIEQGRAIDTANRLAQNRINNQQNQSTANLFDRSLMNDLSNIGSQFREESVAQQAITDNKNLANFTNSQILFALNNRYPNFKFSDDVITKFKNGEINLDQLVNYKS